MECERCQDSIEPGEEREYAGRVLCEDCYMDALSPAKTCDPWAVHSAKSFARAGGGAPLLNPLQKEILEYLQEPEGLHPGRFPNGFRSSRPIWNGSLRRCGTWRRFGGNYGRGARWFDYEENNGALKQQAFVMGCAGISALKTFSRICYQ